MLTGHKFEIIYMLKCLIPDRHIKNNRREKTVITIAAVNAKKKQEERRKSPNLSAELAL